jgi:hypothetical protein
VCSPCRAQDVRAGITGIITDAGGGRISGALIEVTSTAQRVSVRATSNREGNYVIAPLTPGTYDLTVSRPGFKQSVRKSLPLASDRTVRVDVQLEVGDNAQTVIVRGSAPLLESESAARSQEIPNVLAEDVPTQGRNPFQLAWSASGVIKTGSWRYLRAFDVAGTTGMSINGGRNQENEILLDGVSNVRGDRTVIQVPTIESVQELRVISNPYDARYGRTGGGVVTIVTRGGENSFHGKLFEYFQAEELNANQAELNRAGIPKPPMTINTFGLMASGPVVVPRIVNAKNHLFWMISWEAMRQRSADPGAATLPLLDWRRGDFSTLKNSRGDPVTIYDPATTQPDGARSPFAANLIPPTRINPVAREVLKYYPAPTGPGDGPAHLNNYVYPSRWVADLDQWIGRADYVLNSRNRFYFRYGRNPFSEFRGLVWGGSNAAEPNGNAPLLRDSRAHALDWTAIVTPAATFNLRIGLSRWETAGGNSFGSGFDPRRLGFAGSLVSQFTTLQFPAFQLGAYQQIGSGRPVARSTDDVYSIQSNLATVIGRSRLVFGTEIRQYKTAAANPGFASGIYSFGKDWTQANSARADGISGNELATFLLGYPSSGWVDRNIDPYYVNRYYALYVQNDFKLLPRLTLNLGLRWDNETPLVERHDRMLRGFDFAAPSPLAPQVPGLDLRGTVLFAGDRGQPRSAFNPDRNNWQPRAGLAWRPAPAWVVRAGYGLTYLGQHEAGSPQGFSRTTYYSPSLNTVTPVNSLDDPFSNLPAGRLLAPIGSSLGPRSFLGESLTVNFLARSLPYAHQFSVDVSRQFGNSLVIEAAFSGNLTRGLPVTANLRALPAAEMGRRTASGAIDFAYYNAALPNPMAGLIPGNPAKNAPFIGRADLLTPFPQYNSLALANIPIGRQGYRAFHLKATRRYAHGLTLLASYGLMRNLESVSLLNQQDFVLNNPAASPLEERSSTFIDIPRKFSITGVWELPGTHAAPRWIERLWQGFAISWDVTYQSGWTIDYPNARQVRPGSASLPSSQRTFAHYFDTSLWEPVAQEPFTLRDFPTRFSDVRAPGYQNWDVAAFRAFRLSDLLRLRFRCELINAFNHPWFANLAAGALDVTSSSFGRLDPVQRNLPRFMKLAVDMTW